MLAINNVFRFTFFFFSEIKIEPNAPSDADSVGVAIPNKIEPKTMIIRVIGGKIIVSIFKKLIFVLSIKLLSGKIPGRILEQIIILTINSICLHQQSNKKC